MQLVFGIILGFSFAASATTIQEDTKKATSKVFPYCSTNYTSQHDIFSLTLPVTINGSRMDAKDILNPHKQLFFVEADVNDNGEKDYKGLYVLIDNVATKLLDHGTDVTTTTDPNAAVYFSTMEGLYVYIAKERKAEKYGNLTDYIISVEKLRGSDTFYILTDVHDLYKVIDNGHNKIKINKVNNAQKILLDSSNNLYYYSSDKKLYVMKADGVKKIEGLPEHPTRVDMFKPIIALTNSVLFISDDKTYLISNGIISRDPMVILFQFRVMPTSCAMEGTLLQYYAYDKKICMYNTIEVWVRKIITLHVVKSSSAHRTTISLNSPEFYNILAEL